MTWTDEQKKDIMALWEAGKSAAYIADIFNTSRSAVCGLANRNGWVTPNKPHSGTRKPTEKGKRQVPHNIMKAARRRSSPAPLPPMEPDPEPTVDDMAIPLEQRRTLLQLSDKVCHWPVGDSKSADFFFCGAPPIDDCSYCGPHYRRSIQPARPRWMRSFSLQKISVRL